MARRVLCFLGSIMISAVAQPPSKMVPVSDDDIRKTLIERVDVLHQSVGLVVGVVTPEGWKIIAHGSVAKGDGVHRTAIRFLRSVRYPRYSLRFCFPAWLCYRRLQFPAIPQSSFIG